MAMRGTTKKAGAAFVHQLLGLWGGLFLGGLFGCFVVNLSLAFEMLGLVDSLLARLHHRPVETLVLLLDHHLAQPILLRVHQLLLLLLAQLLLRFANFHLHLGLFRLILLIVVIAFYVAGGFFFLLLCLFILFLHESSS